MWSFFLINRQSMKLLCCCAFRTSTRTTLLKCLVHFRWHSFFQGPRRQCLQTISFFRSTFYKLSLSSPLGGKSQPLGLFQQVFCALFLFLFLFRFICVTERELNEMTLFFSRSSFNKVFSLEFWWLPGIVRDQSWSLPFPGAHWVGNATVV